MDSGSFKLVRQNVATVRDLLLCAKQLRSFEEGHPNIVLRKLYVRMIIIASELSQTLEYDKEYKDILDKLSDCDGDDSNISALIKSTAALETSLTSAVKEAALS